jgi:hypothetical protein
LFSGCSQFFPRRRYTHRQKRRVAQTSTDSITSTAKVSQCMSRPFAVGSFLRRIPGFMGQGTIEAIAALATELRQGNLLPEENE